MSAPEAVALIGMGFLIGAYATAIGAGGGFLIAPLLLIRHPDADPPAVTMASLAVVAVTAITSSVVIAREGVADRRLALAMATVAVPAALFGAAGTAIVPRDVFALGFAAFLGALAVYIVWRPVAGIVAPARRAWRREIVTRDGIRYSYRIPVLQSIVPNVAAAFLSALAGIGGGPLGVPIMTRVMRVPHAVAVPSMHFLISIQASSVVAFHLLSGNAGDPLLDVPWLGLGVVLANPAGQRLRRTLGEGNLMRALALGLFVVAVRTGWEAL